MKSFKYLYYILEKRKNPEQNPKYTPFDIIKKYKDDPDVYISYINDIQGIAKVGINPKSHYNTPLGVYCYPLKQAYDLYITDQGNLSNVPFAGSNKYVAILKKKEKTKFVDDMYTDYDSSDYDRDYSKLYKYFVKEHNIYSDQKFGEIVNFALSNAKEQNPIMSMWLLTRTLAVFMNNTNLQNKMEDVTLDDLHIDQDKGVLNKNSLSWNRILNKILGYDGFADKTKHGYIHSSEPMQAVFLTPISYKIIYIVKNIDEKIIEDNMKKAYLNYKILQRAIKRNDTKFIDYISNNYRLAFKIAKNILSIDKDKKDRINNLNKLPEFIINSIAQDEDSAYDFASLLTNNFTKNLDKIPKNIYNMLISNPYNARNYAQQITNNYTQNLDILNGQLLDSIAKDDRYLIDISDFITNNFTLDISLIPKQIYNLIKTDPNMLYYFIRRYTNNFTTRLDKIPKDLEDSILSSQPDDIIQYITHLTHNFTVNMEFITPKMFKIILHIPHLLNRYLIRYTDNFTKNLDKLTPEIILNLDHNNLQILGELWNALKQNNKLDIIPNAVYEKISTYPSSALRFVFTITNMLKNTENINLIPKILLRSIFSSAPVLYNYMATLTDHFTKNLEEVTDGVKEMLINDINTQSIFLKRYTNNFTKNLEFITPNIIEILSKDITNYYTFIKNLTQDFTINLEKIPKDFIEKLKQDSHIYFNYYNTISSEFTNVNKLPVEFFDVISHNSTLLVQYIRTSTHNYNDNFDKLPEQAFKFLVSNHMSDLSTLDLLRRILKSKYLDKTTLNKLILEVDNASAALEIVISMTKDFTTNLDTIPQKLINIISKDIGTAYIYAKRCSNMFYDGLNNIPKPILNIILTDPKYCYFIVKYLTHEWDIHYIDLIPQEVLKPIESDVLRCYQMLNNLTSEFTKNIEIVKQNFPNLIKNAAPAYQNIKTIFNIQNESIRVYQYTKTMESLYE